MLTCHLPTKFVYHLRGKGEKHQHSITAECRSCLNFLLEHHRQPSNITTTSMYQISMIEHAPDHHQKKISTKCLGKVFSFIYKKITIKLVCLVFTRKIQSNKLAGLSNKPVTITNCFARKKFERKLSRTHTHAIKNNNEDDIKWTRE